MDRSHMLLNVTTNCVAQGLIQSGLLSFCGRREHDLSSSLCCCLTLLKVKNYLLVATLNATYFHPSLLLSALPPFISAMSLGPLLDHHSVGSGDCFSVSTGHPFIGSGGYCQVPADHSFPWLNKPWSHSFSSQSKCSCPDHLGSSRHSLS